MTMTRKQKGGALGTAAAGVIAITVGFLPMWEGMDKVAKKDMIGTGRPMTYCYGQTDEFGKVKAGTRFTKTQCDALLAESLPKYLARIEHCIERPLPDKVWAALLDASYNAGPGAVCRSPMVAKMNAGDLVGGCNAFRGWYVRSDGQVRKGLIARRSGVGDGRKSERDLCLEGVKEGLTPATAVKATAASDPYACYGAARYDAMSRGLDECSPPKPAAPPAKKHWWSR